MDVSEISADVIIIGGGITGLAAAYYLQQKAPHLSIYLLEQSHRPGGKIITDQVAGFIIEAGPDCFLSRKPGGIQLCQALGIADQVIGRDPHHPHTFIKRHGRLHRLPTGLTGMIPTDLEALRQSTLLSPAAQRAVAAEPSLPPAPDMGDESVADFVIRRLGRETFENLIEPLMGGIYAGQADRLSLAATFPQLRQLERQYGSLLKGLTDRSPNQTNAFPPFVSLPGGMGQLVESLLPHLSNVKLMTNTRATHIAQRLHAPEAARRSFQVSATVNGEAQVMTATTLIVTTPAYVSASLLSLLDPALSAALNGIPYASTVLVNLAFRTNEVPTPLNGYGYIIPRVEGSPVLACTWSSRKWPGRAPTDQVLLRIYIGRFGLNVTDYPNGRLVKLALDELRQTLDITAAPTLTRIHRWPDAMPQYNLGHLDTVAEIHRLRNRHPGLFLAGNYFNGVGIPDSIVSGEAAAAGAYAHQQAAVTA